MSLLTLLIIAAVLGVVTSFVMGIAAMTNHGQVGHHTSAQWMTLRVVFQALALGLLVLMLYA